MSVQWCPGEGAIVPAGAWHRPRMTKPATFLFVTPTPSRTQHRPALRGDEVLAGPLSHLKAPGNE